MTKAQQKDLLSPISIITKSQDDIKFHFVSIKVGQIRPSSLSVIHFVLVTL